MEIQLNLTPEMMNNPATRLMGLIVSAFVLVIFWGLFLFFTMLELPVFMQTRCPHWTETKGEIIALIPVEVHPGLEQVAGQSTPLVEYRTASKEIRQCEGVFSSGGYTVGKTVTVRYNKKKGVLADDNLYYTIKFAIRGGAAAVLLLFTILWIFKLRKHIREQKFSY